jgi:hypothetical protein
MKDTQCVAFLQWALPRLRVPWHARGRGGVSHTRALHHAERDGYFRGYHQNSVRRKRTERSSRKPPSVRSPV